MATSLAGTTTAAPQGRLKSMLRSINTRSSAVPAAHRTPGIPTGHTSTLSTKPDGTPSPNHPPTTRPKSTPPRPTHYISPDSASTTTTVKIQPVLSRSTSGPSGPPTSRPASPGSASSSSNESIDREVFENGIAARKHYRELESKLDIRREAWRKDPRNQHLSDYELNEGAKRIEFEDPEMQGLYRYVYS